MFVDFTMRKFIKSLFICTVLKFLLNASKYIITHTYIIQRIRKVMQCNTSIYLEWIEISILYFLQNHISVCSGGEGTSIDVSSPFCQNGDRSRVNWNFKKQYKSLHFVTYNYWKGILSRKVIMFRKIGFYDTICGLRYEIDQMSNYDKLPSTWTGLAYTTSNASLIYFFPLPCRLKQSFPLKGRVCTIQNSISCPQNGI